MKKFSEWLLEFDQQGQVRSILNDLGYVGNIIANPQANHDYGDFTRKIQQLYKMVGNEDNARSFQGLLSAWQDLADAVSQGGSSVKNGMPLSKDYWRATERPAQNFKFYLKHIKDSLGQGDPQAQSPAAPQHTPGHWQGQNQPPQNRW